MHIPPPPPKFKGSGTSGVYMSSVCIPFRLVTENIISTFIQAFFNIPHLFCDLPL